MSGEPYLGYIILDCSAWQPQEIESECPYHSECSESSIKELKRLSKQTTVKTTTVQVGGKKKARKTSTNNTTRPKQRKQRTAAQIRAQHYQLSMCSKDYLRAVLDPFQVWNGPLPCIPDLYDSPSQKIRLQQRGILRAPGNSSTNNYTGFLLLDVYNAICQDYTTVAWSGADYAADGFPTSYATAGVNETGMNQSPYTSTDFGETAGTKQYRPVAAGIRVRYAGTELERGGNVIPFKHPQNKSISAYSTANCLSFQEARRVPVTRGWHGVFYLPHTAEDYEYRIGVGDQPAPGLDGSIGILIHSGGANATLYEWEVVCYYEVTGSVQTATASHSDVGGMSAIRTLLEGGFDGDPSTSMYREAINKISKLTPNDISGFASGAAAGARMMGLM